MALRLWLGAREREGDRVGLAVELGSVRRVGVADGGATYDHDSPARMGSPFMPPTCTKKLRCDTPAIESAEARALLGQAGASSLPARHPNERSHVGQPVPTYSTVSLPERPHVDTVSRPPSGTSPRKSEYTKRGPGKKVLKPTLQTPLVYMPGLPLLAVDSHGAVPLAPRSAVTYGSPRQMGDVGVGVRVRVALPVLDRVAVRVRVPEGVALALRVAVALAVVVDVGEAVCEAVCEAVTDAVLVELAVSDDVCEAVIDAVLVKLAVTDDVCEAVIDAVLVELDDAVPVWLLVPVGLDEPVPVELDDGVLVWLLVPVELDEPVPVALLVAVIEGVLVPVAVQVEDSVLV